MPSRCVVDLARPCEDTRHPITLGQYSQQSPGVAHDGRIGSPRPLLFASPRTHRLPLSQGVCFDEQVIDEVPTSASDVPLDFVLTPSRAYSRSDGGAS